MITGRASRLPYPLTTFALLAAFLGWMFILAGNLGIGSESNQFPLGPIIATVLVTLAIGTGAFRWWGRRLARLRTGLGWYLFAFVAPIVIMVAAVLVNSLFGAPLPTAAQLAGWKELGGTYVGILLFIGVGEEAGWTAFAAPILLGRHRFVVAWLILAAIRTFWHIPLMLSGELPLVTGLVGNFAFQFLILWVYRRTDVWLLAALWHGTLNTVGGQFLSRMVDGPDRARLDLLMVAGYVLLAVAVAVIERRRSGGVIAGSMATSDPAPFG